MICFAPLHPDHIFSLCNLLAVQLLKPPTAWWSHPLDRQSFNLCGTWESRLRRRPWKPWVGPRCHMSWDRRRVASDVLLLKECLTAAKRRAGGFHRCFDHCFFLAVFPFLRTENPWGKSCWGHFQHHPGDFRGVSWLKACLDTPSVLQRFAAFAPLLAARHRWNGALNPGKGQLTHCTSIPCRFWSAAKWPNRNHLRSGHVGHVWLNYSPPSKPPRCLVQYDYGTSPAAEMPSVVCWINAQFGEMPISIHYLYDIIIYIYT